LQGKSKLFSLALAAVAGLAIGFVATTFVYSTNLLRLPGEGPLHRMDRVLKLTPAEKVQIGEVMEATRENIQQARRNLSEQRRKLLIGAYIRIRAILTPEQQRLFDRDFVPPGFRHGFEASPETGAAVPGTSPAGEHRDPGF
jgi:Spy/CpxP family protein refolding chaperone